MTLGRLFAATVLGASLMAAGPAFSDPKHCPPGWAKKGKCSPEQIARDWRGDRDWDRDWDRRNRLEEARERAYEEGYRDAMDDAWRIGDRVPRDRYRVVPDYNEFGWPDPRAGSRYVYADDRYYLIEQATGLVLDILTR